MKIFLTIICYLASFCFAFEMEVAVFRLQTDYRVQTVSVAGEFNGWSYDATPMRRGADGVWTVDFELPKGRYLYKFVIDGNQWLADPKNKLTESDGYGGENSVLLLGVSQEEAEELVKHDDYSLDQVTPIEIETPDWTKDAIWYQIMVDRFRDGSPETNPEHFRKWTSEWYTPSESEGEDGQTFYKYFVFSRLYGGDFQGLTEKLDYLQELGVNALYLNPVFQSESHHKYNATSFVHIDEHYGGGLDYKKIEAIEDLNDPESWVFNDSDKAFLAFLREAKQRGFKVIIDAVFNHVGTRHPAFQDLKENKGDSAYYNWFDVHSFEPFEYACWAGFTELPSFRKVGDGLHPDVEAHIFAITKRWMDPDGDGDPSDGIDGWRLDVPNEIATGFWKRWRKLVKEINPEAYISGEIWSNASSWLTGDTFDAVMNYQFAQNALRWVGDNTRKLSATQCAANLARIRNSYAPQATYALQNLLDSHDTDRLVSKLYNPDRAYDSGNREQEDATYNGSKPQKEMYKKARLLALLQAAYVGAPMIYYGDEAGMWGSDDPNNRKPMLWKDLEPYDSSELNHVDTNHLAYYKEVFNLRKNHKALRRGSFKTVLTDDENDVWVFERSIESETILIALTPAFNAFSFELPEGNWETLFKTDGGQVWLKK